MSGGERIRRMLAALAWGFGLLLASHSPSARALWPALGTLLGPLGVALGVVAVAVAASQLLAGRMPAWRTPGPPALFVIGVVLYGSVGLYYTARLQASGDEPHYLLMAQSLWQEHDLDLRDNLAREDYLDYTPGPLVPHYGAPRRDGRPFPAHSPGLPMLLAPVYAAGGRSACVILLAFLASALALAARALALDATGSDDAALWAWALTLGPPVAFYSFHIYTEVPAALALAVALLILRRPVSGVGGAVAAALLTAALPWLHLKMLFAAAGLGILALVRLRGRPRLAFVAVALAMAAGFLAHYVHVFGRASPLAIYGGIPRDATAVPWIAATGLLLDRSFGLLPIAPLFLIALAGLPLLGKRGRWALVVLGALVLAPVLKWRMWWGGQCPPARFLVPLVPLLAVAIALRLQGGPRGLARWRWPLLTIGAVLFAFTVARPTDRLLLNRADHPTRLWAALSGETQVERYMPSLASADRAEGKVAIVWLAALALLLALDRLAQARAKADRLFSGLGLPVLLLSAISVFVEVWARDG